MTNNQIICMFLQWYRVIQELVMKLGTKFHPFLYTKVFFTGYDHIDIYVFLHKNFLRVRTSTPTGYAISSCTTLYINIHSLHWYDKGNLHFWPLDMFTCLLCQNKNFIHMYLHKYFCINVALIVSMRTH